MRSLGKPRSPECRTRLQVERARGFEEAREDEEVLVVRHGEEVREVEDVFEVQANWVEFEPWEDEVVWIFPSDDCFWWTCGTGRLPRRVGGRWSRYRAGNRVREKRGKKRRPAGSKSGREI